MFFQMTYIAFANIPQVFPIKAPFILISRVGIFWIMEIIHFGVPNLCDIRSGVTNSQGRLIFSRGQVELDKFSSTSAG